jgi:hypothetical protein
MAKGRQELTPAACICASICRFVGDQNSLLSATTQVTSLAAKSHRASFARGLSFST